MKIAERMFHEDGRLIVKETHDYNPALEAAALLRAMGKETQGESKVIAVIPAKIQVEWAKKWGVRLDDHAAMRQVVDRELADPANRGFRVWEGTY